MRHDAAVSTVGSELGSYRAQKMARMIVRSLGFGRPCGLSAFFFAALFVGPLAAQTFPPVRDVVQVAAGLGHTCALTSGGGVKCWGRNDYGQLGDGSTTQRLATTDVAGLGSGVVAVTAGNFHTCALMTGARVKCWGAGNLLGNGGSPNSTIPVHVASLGSGVAAISAGDQHTCIMTTAGGMKCWGSNSSGQLGNGSTTQVLTPMDVPSLVSGVSAISAGQQHTCAVTVGGGVKCWGKNQFGRLGDGSSIDRLVPTDVTGIASGAAAVSAGGNHSCALMVDASVKCWGDNAYGQLGDGTITQRLAPVDVSGLANVSEIRTGRDYHTCSLTQGGGMKCWGGNFSGQLGDGTTTRRYSPIDVPTLTSSVAAIGLNNNHTCAVTADSGLKCWGLNTNGQLGDGSTTQRLTPVDVLVNSVLGEVAAVTPAGDNASRVPIPDASGRYVVFESRAGNLTGLPDINNASDIFRVDTQTGDTLRLSVDDAEGEITGDSIEPWVSADGQFAVFVAPANSVNKLHRESKSVRVKRLKGTGNIVVLRNLARGTSQQMGLATPGGIGTRPVIAPDGQSVVFTGLPASGEGSAVQPNVIKVPLVPDGAGDVMPGMRRCVSCKSVSVMGLDTGEDADGESRNAQVSADGRYIAWETQAKNGKLDDPSPCATGVTQVMLRDLVTGISQRVSLPPGLAATACGTRGATKPSIDWPGGKIAFESDQPLTPGSGAQSEVFVATIGTGVVFERVSQLAGGTSVVGESRDASISGDGDTVAFVSAATNLDGSFVDTNNRADIHAKVLGRAGGPERLSLGTQGAQANEDGRVPRLNYNATLMVFDSQASNLVQNDSNGNISDVFQRVLPANTDIVFNAGFE